MATSKTTTTTPATTAPQNAAPPATKQNNSERFTNMVFRQFGQNVAGTFQVTDAQKRLIQGYFIVIDRVLKTAEENRLRKNESNRDHKWDNPLPCTWENVNLNDLALDLMHYARMGLDMMQDNHLSPIPYRNNKTNRYDITLMPGYNGIRYIAEKYAVDPPCAVTTELVYSTDTFKALKKSASNKVESYEFEINNPFDRGQVVGGFGYIEYADPLKNELIIMTMRDIEKRKPKTAAAEFWGGTKKDYKTGEETAIDGWFEEMCLKTIKREVYSAKHIPRDPQKVDESYQFIKSREIQYAQWEAQAEIDSGANATLIETPTYPAPAQLPAVDPGTGEITDEAPQKQTQYVGDQAVMEDTGAGPDF